jgi:hypothetical protein
MSGFVWNSCLLPPLQEWHLLQFTAYCHAQLKIKVGTIKSYLCGIRFEYLKKNVPNPWSDSKMLSLQTILKAVKKLQGKPVISRLPISKDILTMLCLALRKGVFDRYTDCLMQAVCTCAFFAFLRCGEFTCDRFCTVTHLNMGCVNFTGDKSSFCLTLQTSKTDLFKKGVRINVFQTGTVCCPVQAMQRYLNTRTHARLCDPLFLTRENKALDRCGFIHKLRTLLTLIGLPPDQYNGHSFRIGAATSAAKAGVPDHVIKTLGRWSSDCYVRYIRIPNTTLAKAHMDMAHTS